MLCLSFAQISDPNAWLALATLTALEVVLGIDNLVFISILTDRLPVAQRPKARRVGLLLAMIMRIALLATLSMIVTFTAPLFTVLGNGISGRDIILILGGLFLLAKSTLELHEQVEDGTRDRSDGRAGATLGGVLVQIALLDLVFSLDSVITAVGMADDIAIMVTAVVLSMVVMVLFVNKIAAFVERHPTFKTLALSFLILIGVALIADGLDLHIPKGYVYFSMVFALGVELLNLRVRRRPLLPRP